MVTMQSYIASFAGETRIESTLETFYDDLKREIPNISERVWHREHMQVCDQYDRPIIWSQHSSPEVFYIQYQKGAPLQRASPFFKLHIYLNEC